MDFKFWYFASLIFLIFNLIKLKEDSRRVRFYTRVFENNNYSYSFCIPIWHLVSKSIFFYNQTYPPKTLIDTVSSLYLNGSEKIINLQQSYIYHHHICLEFDPNMFYELLPKINKLEFKIFLRHSLDYIPYFFDNAYKHNPNFTQSFNLQVSTFQVSYKEHPFFTNCTRFKVYEGIKRPYYRLSCLLRCHKSKLNHALFHYEYNENVNIHIFDLKFKSSRECEEFCGGKYDCYSFFQFSHIKVKKRKEQLTTPKIELDATYFDGYALISGISYYLQLCNLVLLIFNQNISQLILYLIIGFESQIKTLKIKLLIRTLLPKIRILIFLSCILSMHVVASFFYEQYKRYEFKVKGYTSATNEFRNFTLIICIPIQISYLNRLGFSENINVSIQNEHLFMNESFLEIEKKTDNLYYESIEKVYLLKGSMKYDIKIKLINQTAFKKEKFIIRTDNDEKIKLFSRCFTIDLHIKEDFFTKELAFTELIFELKHPYFRSFNLDYKRKLNSNHKFSKLVSKFYFREIRFLQSPYKSNCKDYPESNLNCCSKWRCINKKYNQLFLDNYSSISTNSVIYKFDFEFRNLSNVYFTYKEDESIKNKAIELYPNRDCLEFYFIEELEQEEMLKNSSNMMVVELYFFKEFRYEAKDMTWLNLCLTIFNFESLVLGFNMGNLVNLIMNLLRSKFNRKILDFIKFNLKMICFLLFIIHSCYLINETINDLEKTSYFEKNEEIKLEPFIICFEFNISDADENRMLTIEYLDELTSHINIDNIFDKITLFNETLDQFEVSFKNLHLIEHKLKWFYFYAHSLKCFEFIPTGFIGFREENLFHFNELFFIKIYLNPVIYERFEHRVFRIFIAIFDINSKKLDRLAAYFMKEKSRTKVSLKIVPNKLQIVYHDKFYFFRNPLALFSCGKMADTTSVYHEKLKKNFVEATNFSTQLLPLYQSNTNLEIRDDLLIQYYNQIQKELDEYQLINPNYDSTYYNINPMSSFVSKDSAELIFLPTFIRIKQLISNKYNFSELIINILNPLSLWLAFSILDLSIFVYDFLNFYRKFYLFLTRFRRYLDQFLV